MSDTPRTDAEEYLDEKVVWIVRASVAVELETKLLAVTAERDALAEQVRTLTEQVAWMSQKSEALAAVVDYSPYHSDFQCAEDKARFVISKLSNDLEEEQCAVTHLQSEWARLDSALTTAKQERDATIAQLRKELEEAKQALRDRIMEVCGSLVFVNMFQETTKDRDAALASLATAQAQVAALQADKDRLDWLEKHSPHIVCENGIYCVTRVDSEGEWHDSRGESLREAIDAARTAPAEEGAK